MAMRTFCLKAIGMLLLASQLELMALAFVPRSSLFRPRSSQSSAGVDAEALKIRNSRSCFKTVRSQYLKRQHNSGSIILRMGAFDEMINGLFVTALSGFGIGVFLVLFFASDTDELRQKNKELLENGKYEESGLSPADLRLLTHQLKKKALTELSPPTSDFVDERAIGLTEITPVGNGIGSSAESVGREEVRGSLQPSTQKPYLDSFLRSNKVAADEGWGKNYRGQKARLATMSSRALPAAMLPTTQPVANSTTGSSNPTTSESMSVPLPSQRSMPAEESRPKSPTFAAIRIEPSANNTGLNSDAIASPTTRRPQISPASTLIFDRQASVISYNDPLVRSSTVETAAQASTTGAAFSPLPSVGPVGQAPLPSVGPVGQAQSASYLEALGGIRGQIKKALFSPTTKWMSAQRTSTASSSYLVSLSNCSVSNDTAVISDPFPTWMTPAPGQGSQQQNGSYRQELSSSEMKSAYQSPNDDWTHSSKTVSGTSSLGSLSDRQKLASEAQQTYLDELGGGESKSKQLSYGPRDSWMAKSTTSATNSTYLGWLTGTASPSRQPTSSSADTFFPPSYQQTPPLPFTTVSSVTSTGQANQSGQTYQNQMRSGSYLDMLGGSSNKRKPTFYSPSKSSNASFANNSYLGSLSGISLSPSTESSFASVTNQSYSISTTSTSSMPSNAGTEFAAAVTRGVPTQSLAGQGYSGSYIDSLGGKKGKIKPSSYGPSKSWTSMVQDFSSDISYLASLTDTSTTTRTKQSSSSYPEGLPLSSVNSISSRVPFLSLPTSAQEEIPLSGSYLNSLDGNRAKLVRYGPSDKWLSSKTSSSSYLSSLSASDGPTPESPLYFIPPTNE